VVAFRRGGDRARWRASLSGATPADIVDLRRCIAAAGVVLQLASTSLARAEAVAQLPADEQKERARSGLEAAEPEAPGTRRLEVTGFQCEALALGKSVKDLPSDARVEAITFTDPPPITYRLPEQRRESLTECSLRASGLTVRVDKSRHVITLLPTGTGSPELPNPTVKVVVKLSEEPQKPEQQ
jgi:hypothetical protein